jgi:4-hydroxybenzoate polyprenyltransferase
MPADPALRPRPSGDAPGDAPAAASPAPGASAPPLPAPVLAVDLDGTLIRSDMLYETFWAAASARWTNALRAAAALRQGKAALKRRLAGLATVDPALLPYDEAVLAYLRDWRARGGRTALVSASDQGVVDAVAAHLGLFDEAHGSDGSHNLKGPNKAEFLAERFPDGFAYAGDHAADRAVWARAAHAVTVGAPPGLRAEAEAAAPTAEHIGAPPGGARALLRAMRPHQWLKNVLVFVPMGAAHALDGATALSALAAFVSFSLTASSVYLLNDLLDLASDRAHPRKRARPFASGALPLRVGTVATPALLLAGMAIAALLGPAFLGVMLLYYAVTTAYSFNLKRRLIVDICTLAGLYTLRIVAGGVATGIPLSVWLLAFSIFFFFALAAMKRQAELVAGAAAGELKAHGRGYQVGDLPLVSTMAVASGYVSVLVSALYVNSNAVRTLYGDHVPLWGICLVLLYWLSRMVMITHRGWMHDDPVVFAARDRISQLCGLAILGLAIVATLL